ncbi:hypothetical protein VNI00_013875 [Paramarasmius palmivorus]|uniref:Uncharacterized protein n=1 Tax=Paramarasmius palmivorus TaxID=297713 RepID=A0AAW0C073_9AGAR
MERRGYDADILEPTYNAHVEFLEGMKANKPQVFHDMSRLFGLATGQTVVKDVAADIEYDSADDHAMDRLLGHRPVTWITVRLTKEGSNVVAPSMKSHGLLLKTFRIQILVITTNTKVGVRV